MRVKVDKPKVIYHYCGLTGFVGIVKGKALWLSDAYYMNDYLEHRLIIDKAIQHIEMARAGGDDCPSHDALLQLIHGVPIHPYICCFSLEGDLLSQWRAYADDGAGFAIGFSTAEIEKRCAEQAKSKELGITLEAVVYDPAEHEELIAKELAKLRNKRDNPDTLGAAMWTYGAIWRQAARCKNSGFREESECRVVLMPKLTENVTLDKAFPEIGTSPVCFRVRGSQIIPYFELTFEPKDIVEIRLGPKNDARVMPYGLEMFLRHNGIDRDSVSIIKSEASYR